MSLEDKLSENTAALNRLSDLMEKGGSTGSTGSKTTGTKTTGTKASKPKHTVEQVKAAIMKVKEEKSADAAKAIIEAHAGAGKKLADLANLPDKFDAAVADCEAALAAGDDDGDDEDDI